MQGFMSSVSEVVTGDKSLDKLYVEANNLKNKISNENSVIYFPYVKSSEDYDSLYLYYNYLKHRVPLGVDERNHLKSRTKLKKELQVDLLKTLLSVCNFVLPRKINKAKIIGNGNLTHCIVRPKTDTKKILDIETSVDNSKHLASKCSNDKEKFNEIVNNNLNRIINMDMDKLLDYLQDRNLIKTKMTNSIK